MKSRMSKKLVNLAHEVLGHGMAVYHSECPLVQLECALDELIDLKRYPEKWSEGATWTKQR